ncbi:MAG: hypothetical protein GDA38_26295, partial [Hormoscilla sp. SP12CHS1]|nr:hypothetical protein [Hormoscilla sp. SP12CHS1]
MAIIGLAIVQANDDILKTKTYLPRASVHYSLFKKQVEHFCAKLELYSMQTQFSYGTLLS